MVGIRGGRRLAWVLDPPTRHRLYQWRFRPDAGGDRSCHQPGRGVERLGIAWRELAARGRAAIVEARVDDQVMASGMLVLEGDRSFYLFSGSLREAPGARKRFPSYAMQWEMIRLARTLGSRAHDLWAIAPLDAGPEHPSHRIGTFKRSFGGRGIVWPGSWDLILRPRLYRLRSAWAGLRGQ